MFILNNLFWQHVHIACMSNDSTITNENTNNRIDLAVKHSTYS